MKRRYERRESGEAGAIPDGRVSGVGGASEHDLERLAKLRLMDDEFMRVALRGRLDLAQLILRVLLGIADLVLVEGRVQFDLKRLAGSRSVVLDFFGVDSEGRVYNLEIERSEKGADPKRARYYGAAMDAETLGAGKDFHELPERFNVFIVESDPFRCGAALYRFEQSDPDTGLALGDGVRVVYGNGAYRGDDEVGRLMHDLSCSDPDDMHPGPLRDRVRELKCSEKGEAQMGWFTEEVRAEGIEIGMERGMERGRLEALAELVRDGAITAAAAAERMGISPEQFAARAAEDGLALAP